jgi:hypothetical protein
LIASVTAIVAGYTWLYFSAGKNVQREIKKLQPGKLTTSSNNTKDHDR